MTTTSSATTAHAAAIKAAAAKAAAAKAAQAKAAPAAAALPTSAQLPLMGGNVGAPGLVSPYDGTTPNPAVGAGLGGYPVEAGTMPGSLGGLDAGRAQTNATNQSALATNGNVNQDVKNENSYHNTYLNIIQSPFGSPYGYGGVTNGAFAGYGAQAYGQNGFGQPYVIDPQTGQVYVQKKDGILGWIQRLFRGY